jgi:hypothetical protein
MIDPGAPPVHVPRKEARHPPRLGVGAHREGAGGPLQPPRPRLADKAFDRTYHVCHGRTARRMGASDLV